MKSDDTFFLNPDEALRVAKQQNKRSRYVLQVCYYDGERANFDTERLPNLIPVSLNNLVDDLALGIHRLPDSISFDGLDLSIKVKKEIVENFELSIRQAHIIRGELKKHYLQSIKEARPDFKEPLRFYLQASAYTQVMQYVSRNIADALENMGYEVLFNLNYGTLEDDCQKLLKEFNPHAIININHMNNSFLGEEVFNFVWFQDAMPVLTNNEKVIVRNRDYVYSLTRGLKELVTKKGIANELIPFMMNKKLYKTRDNIKKEKKIVFIGSSYAHRIAQIKDQSGFTQVFEEAVQIFEEKSCLKGLEHKESDIDYLMKKYEKSQQFIENIASYLTRDYCVEKLCTIDTDYEIEIYGWGWENNETVKPYYKGVVEYGEDISKIYNSATYGYCPGGYVLMQRTLECAFSETIPLVLDIRADEQDEYDVRIEEALELFKINELQEVLSREPHKKKFDFIKQEYSYEHFITKCIQIIKEETT